MQTLTHLIAAALITVSNAGSAEPGHTGDRAVSPAFAQADPLPPLRIIDADPASVLPGVTRASREVTVGTSFDTRLMRVPVEEGQVVLAGELVAELDDRVTRAALLVSEAEATHDAQVLRARAIMLRAKEAMERSEKVHASGASNGEQLAEARNRFAIASADLRMAEEVFEKAGLQLELTRAQLAEHHLRAPFDAVVVRVNATPGEVLSPGDAIVELAALDSARADIYLPAAVGLALRAGDRVALRAAEPIDAVIPAAVRYVERRVDPISETCRVTFEFEAPRLAVPSGVLVSIAERLPEQTDTDRLVSFLDLNNTVIRAADAPADSATASAADQRE